MKQQLENDNFIRALLRQPTEYTPVWLMRQAGRYLPEYRVTRQKAGDFMTLCQTPELACEVTLQPLQRYNLDAAILFSDILTIPHAMNVGLHFAEGEGPVIEKPVRDENAVLALPIPDPETELRYVMDAVRVIKHELHHRVPLIGFAGSPWTIACYMVEGGGSKLFWQIKQMMYQTPEILHALLDKLADAVTLYLNAQIAAGVDAIMIFDTWGGVLTTENYKQFSLAYMQKILTKLQRMNENKIIPRIIFTKGGANWLENMAATDCDALGVDWTIELSQARARVGDKVALQGNLDPAALMAAPARLKEEVANILASYGHGAGHVFNLGHGIDKTTSPEIVSILIDSVHELSKQYHANSKKSL
jgi:uroporphyrinogen decarboxylase